LIERVKDISASRTANFGRSFAFKLFAFEHIVVIEMG